MSDFSTSCVDCNQYSVSSFNLVNHTDQSFLLVLNLNCQSIKNKFDEFQIFLSSININFHVICLTETWLYDDEVNYYDISGYNFVGSQRASRGGGVGIYVRCGLAVEVQETDFTGSDSCSLRLVGDALGSALNVTGIYRRPSADPDLFLLDLEKYLSTTSGNHIILGDINIDYLDEKISQSYKNIISTYDYTNAITIPTRFSENRNSCLDHILTNVTKNPIISGTIITDLSDHLPTFVKFSVPNVSGETRTNSFKFINYHLLSKEMCSVDFSDITHGGEESVDILYDKFIQRLSSTINNCSFQNNTIKQSTKNYRPKRKPWIDNSLLTKISKKHSLYKQSLKSPLNTKLKFRYAQFRNSLCTELRQAKDNYFKRKFLNCSNPQAVWQLLNNEVLTHKNKATKTLPNHLNSLENEKGQNSDKNIANGLNYYFTNVGSNLAKKFSTERLPLCNEIMNETPHNFQFAPIEEDELLTLLETLNTNKATGSDNISAKVIKLNAKVLVKPLWVIFNKSIQTGTFPSKMKHARINPVHKSGSINSAENYRPISILPIFSKIFEKLINKQIMNYLETNKLLEQNQYGFRSNRGTADVLTEFTNNTLTAFNNGNSVLGIFVDFSKAFDTVNHVILLMKLKKIGFNELVLSWFNSYLTKRIQITKIRNAESMPLEIVCGVPQGSVLGTTLFLIYVNDMSKRLKYLIPYLYADDTNLFIESKDLNEIIPKINLDLLSFSDWCLSNKLTINMTKTNYIVLKNPQNKSYLPTNKILLNNSYITQSDTIKFLGIYIDPHLNWSSHINNLLVQIRPLSGLLYRCSKYLSAEILIILYNSLINSKLSYCLDSWGNAPQTSLNKILLLQKRILRYIFKKDFLCHTAPLFKTSNILQIENLYKQKILQKAHKIYYSSTNETLSDHPYNTRFSKTNLPVPFFGTTAGQRTTHYRESALWNGLRADLKDLSSPGAFRAAVRRCLLAGEL